MNGFYGTIGFALMVASLIATCAAAGEQRKYAGFYMTAAEREAMRQRVAQEQWAREFYEQTVLPAARKGEAYPCAVACVISADAGYADRAKAFLLGRAQAYLNSSEQDRARRTWSWGPPQGGQPEELPRVYDLVADKLTPDEDAIMRKYMAGVVDECKTWLSNNRITPNMYAVSISNLAGWAYAIGDDAAISWILEAPATRPKDAQWGGVKTIMNTCVNDKQFWVEPLGYAYITTEGFLKVAAAEKRARGNDLIRFTAPNGTTIRSMIQGQIDRSYPIEQNGKGTNIRMADYGHGGLSIPATFWPNEDAFLISSISRNWIEPHIRQIFLDSPDDTLAWLLSVAEPRQRRTIEFGEAKLPEKVAPPAAASHVWPQSGTAMLRADESPQYWTGKGPAVFVKGGERYGHGHHDRFEITYYANGRLVYPDIIQLMYEIKEVGFAESSVNHNLLLVDGQNTPDNIPTTYRNSFDPERQFFAMRGEVPAPPGRGVQVERILCLTREYLFDATLVEGAADHTYDWAIHGLGTAHADAPDQFARSADLRHYGTGDSYRWLEDERSAKRSDDVVIDIENNGVYSRKPAEMTDPEWNTWYLPQSYQMPWGPEIFRRTGVRLRMLGAPESTVYLLKNPQRHGAVDGASAHALHPEENGPAIIVRRQAKTSGFIALHEPYEQNPRVTRFAALHADLGQLAVRVTAPDFEDTICALSGPLAAKGQGKISSDSDRREEFTFAGEMHVRRSAGRLTVRGEVSSFCLYAPEVPAKGGLIVNGKPAAYTASDGCICFGMNAPKPSGPALRIESVATDATVYAGSSGRPKSSSGCSNSAGIASSAVSCSPWTPPAGCRGGSTPTPSLGGRTPKQCTPSCWPTSSRANRGAWSGTGECTTGRLPITRCRSMASGTNASTARAAQPRR